MSYCRKILVALVVTAILTTFAHAADIYSCDRVATLYDGHHAVQRDSHVKLTLSGDQVQVELNLPTNDADKTMTFRQCSKTKKDQSNFSGWFELECHDMEGFDGTVVSMNKSLVGVYAGISPEVTPTYSMWQALSATSKELGLSLPDRTFVLYSFERKPMYEFFCYRDR